MNHIDDNNLNKERTGSSSIPNASTSIAQNKIKLNNVITKTGFKFPTIYSFPPFFTKQPNQQTWSHQLNIWQEIIKSYCKFHKIFKFQIDRSLESLELFNNQSISRNLNLDTILSIFEIMVQSGGAEYYPTKPSLPLSMTTTIYVLIYFKSISSWAEELYGYISSNGLTNSIMTLHELTTTSFSTSSDENQRQLNQSSPEDCRDLNVILDDNDQSDISLDPIILRKVINFLSKQGKAKLFKGSIDGGPGDGDGVKFF